MFITALLRRKFSIVLGRLTLVLVSLFTSCLSAQFDRSLLDRLDPETAGVVHFENVVTLVDFYDRSIADRVDQILEHCTEEPYPIMTSDAAEQLAEQIEDAKAILGAVDEVDFVIHRWEQGKAMEFTLIVYLDQTSAQELASTTKSVRDLVTGSVNSPESDPAKNRKEEIDSEEHRESKKEGETKQKSFDIRGWSVKVAEINDRNCVLISNTDQLISRIDSEQTNVPKKLLRNTRRFKTFKIFCQRRQTKATTTLMTGYFEPKHLRPLFDPKNNDGVWKALGIEELPIAAVRVAIDDEDLILAETMITTTVPPSGTAARWLAYRPIDSLPSFQQNMVKFIANGIDFRKTIEQQVNYYNQAYGQGTFLKAIGDHFGRNDPAFIERLGRRTDLKFTGQFIGKEGRLDDLNFEHISDRSSMELVVESLVERQDERFKNRKLKLNKRVESGSIIWSYDDSESYRKQWYPVAHAIVGDWYFHGRQPAVREQFDTMREHPFESVPWLDILPTEAKRLAERFQPLSMTHYTPDFWRVHAKMMLASRIIKRGGSSVDPEVVARVKAVRFEDQELEIKSATDRHVSVKNKILHSFIERFGTATNLFRSDDRYFESLLIISPQASDSSK